MSQRTADPHKKFMARPGSLAVLPHFRRDDRRHQGPLAPTNHARLGLALPPSFHIFEGAAATTAVNGGKRQYSVFF
eukprot:CAMPEP_0180645730 /NCGR_PEP_ID=MMETSP1037_2-20121125/49165_1 /TAXON_ID=632150 /ORGANISM="Azadinium spinosum, Strain 3D9" /LENGTH=75 /DNA_ID=CAMNT_0022669647 /DNA_START=83 /DNA_END=307 /DNA_ORIENTATION=-